MLVGMGVTGVSAYMYHVMPVFLFRETPMWAGAPVSCNRCCGGEREGAERTEWERGVCLFVGWLLNVPATG